jgi:hypothetical protein
MDFPSTNTTITDFLELFQTEVQALPIAFPNAMRISLVSL